MLAEALAAQLHNCAKTKSLLHGLLLHAAVIKSGLNSNVFTSNHILNMYAKCGKIPYARKVFDEMPDKNLVSWSAMISGYEQAGHPLMALDLFSQIRFVPNEYIYASVISACAAAKALMLARQIHGQALKFGHASVSFVLNSLISMYMKCGCCDDALSACFSSSERNLVSYNALIAGFVENGEREKGYEVFRIMYREGFVPDRFTFIGALGSCGSLDDGLWRGMGLHCQTIKHGLDGTAFVGNVLMTVYSMFDMIEEAEKVFRMIGDKDVISWNTVITSCSNCDHHAKALIVFKEMTGDCSVRPDDFTFSSVLAACAGLASVRHGRQVHAHLLRTHVCQDMVVSNALVNMYAKCGSIGYANDIFNRMLRHNLVSWNTIISGYATHGHGRRALELFEEMRAAGVSPDAVTFVGLLTACNHAGLVDKGEFYFKSMEKTFGIIPDIEHVSCLIDLLGRAGRLQEAAEYFKKYPYGNDPIVLGSLLSACRLHGDVVIGEHLAKQLLELQPVTSSPYVLLSNLYAADKIWKRAAEARKLLKGSGLKKEPGYSMIEVRGIFEKFTIGDFSHSRIKEIKDTLSFLSWAAGEDALQIST